MRYELFSSHFFLHHIQTESDAYEPTVHMHRWAQKWRDLEVVSSIPSLGRMPKPKIWSGWLLSVTWQNILAYDLTSCDVTEWRHDVSWHHRMTSNSDSMAKTTMTYTQEVRQRWGVFIFYGITCQNLEDHIILHVLGLDNAYSCCMYLRTNNT